MVGTFSYFYILFKISLLTQYSVLSLKINLSKFRAKAEVDDTVQTSTRTSAVGRPADSWNRTILRHSPSFSNYLAGTCGTCIRAKDASDDVSKVLMKTVGANGCTGHRCGQMPREVAGEVKEALMGMGSTFESTGSVEEKMSDVATAAAATAEQTFSDSDLPVEQEYPLMNESEVDNFIRTVILANGRRSSVADDDDDDSSISTIFRRQQLLHFNLNPDHAFLVLLLGNGNCILLQQSLCRYTTKGWLSGSTDEFTSHSGGGLCQYPSEDFLSSEAARSTSSHLHALVEARANHGLGQEVPVERFAFALRNLAKMLFTFHDKTVPNEEWQAAAAQVISFWGGGSVNIGALKARTELFDRKGWGVPQMLGGESEGSSGEDEMFEVMEEKRIDFDFDSSDDGAQSKRPAKVAKKRCHGRFKEELSVMPELLRQPGWIDVTVLTDVADVNSYTPDFNSHVKPLYFTAEVSAATTAAAASTSAQARSKEASVFHSHAVSSAANNVAADLAKKREDFLGVREVKLGLLECERAAKAYEAFEPVQISCPITGDPTLVLRCRGCGSKGGCSGNVCHNHDCEYKGKEPRGGKARLDAAIRNWEAGGKPVGLESYGQFLPECGECAEVA